ASPASIKVLISKLETVRTLQMGNIDLSRLNRNRVRVLAHLGAKYHRDSLLRFSQQKRAALLVCFLQDLQQELLDRLLTSFDDLITSIFRRTESSEKTHHVTHGKALTRHIHTFRTGFQSKAEENASRLQESGVVDSSKEQDFTPKLLVHCSP